MRKSPRPDPGALKGGYNGTLFDSAEALFTDNRWHGVEACFKLNTFGPVK